MASYVIRSLRGVTTTRLGLIARRSNSSVAGSPPADTTTATATTSNLNNIKWEFDGGQGYIEPEQPVIDAVTSAILPFSELNIVQTIFFPYQYPIMHYLDFLTTNCSVPWWMGIIATTATVKLLSFPLVLQQNKIGIRIQNILPETQKLQEKINEATLSGDVYSSAIAKTKLKLLYQEHDVTITKRLVPILLQTPAFMCLFFELRNLAVYYKLPAMSYGGALWFSNLTIADPIFVLPALTSISMFLLMEFGLEGGNKAALMGPTGKYIIRGLPFAFFFIFQSFPAAVCLMWTTNNLFTLLFSLFLRQSYVKKLFNIPKKIDHDPASLPLTNQSFSSQLAKAKEKARVHRTTHDLRKLDDIAFQKAGIGPLKKTYKEPPAKVKLN